MNGIPSRLWPLAILTFLLNTGCAVDRRLCGNPGQPGCPFPPFGILVCNNGGNVGSGGICQGCGGPGQSCCLPISVETSCSTAGYTCASSLSTALTCNACGRAGGPACSNNYCAPPSVFSAGRCVAADATVPTTSSPEPGTGRCPAGQVAYSFGVRSASSRCAIAGGEAATICATSADAARFEIARRYQSVPGYADAEVVDSNVIEIYDRWVFNPDLCVCEHTQVRAFSPDDVERCARQYCGNCTIRDTECPGLGTPERRAACGL